MPVNKKSISMSNHLPDRKREKQLKKILDHLIANLDKSISAFANVYYEDTVDLEIDEVVRFVRYERGDSFYWVAFGHDGYIYYYSPRTPKLLLTEMHNVFIQVWRDLYIETASTNRR